MIEITSWSFYIIFRITDVTLEVIEMYTDYEARMIAIRRDVAGEKPAMIYTSLHRSSAWFFKWKKRYERYGLDGLDDLSSAPHVQVLKTPDAVETAIITLRTLREQREQDETRYALIGAFAIHQELQALGYSPPSGRTVHSILRRHGLIHPPVEQPVTREILDRHYPGFNRNRPGYVHQFDLVGPRYLHGSPQKYSFCHLRDSCSRRVALEIGQDRKAATMVAALIQSWQRMGIPQILQHDNALEFRGSPRYPRSAGLLTKFCLALGVESVFIPSRQPYRNGSIENFNGLFQRLVLETQHLENFPHLQQAVTTFEQVANTQHPHVPLHGKTSLDYERSVKFHPRLLAPDFTFQPRSPFCCPPEGKVSFICRIRKSGRITIATEKFDLDPELAWDYVYATIFVKEQMLKIYHNGKVLKEFPYELKL
jgi:putative transposase